MRLLSEVTEAPIPKPVTKTVKEARAEFLAEHYRGSTTRWPRVVQLKLEKHLKPVAHKKLVTLDDGDIQSILAKLQKTPSMQLHVYRALRTFLTWCTRPPRRYLKHSPIEGYPSPGKDRRATRILSDLELKAVWNVSGSGTRQIVRLMILWGTRNTETCSIMRAWRQGETLTISGTHTKNGRDHGIPILPLAAAILDERIQDGDSYFPGRYNDRALNS